MMNRDSQIKFENNFFALDNGIRGDTLYLFGGYHSFDHGCDSWGTNDPTHAHFIGDEAGKIILTFTDECKKEIPLIFGYTLWFYANWQDSKAPFDGEGRDEKASKLLQDTLHLWGGFEGEKVCALKITDCAGLKSIVITGNPPKQGSPIFTDGFFCKKEEPFSVAVQERILTQDIPFFAEHTLSADAPFPENIQHNLRQLNQLLVTDEKDRQTVLPYTLPADYQGVKVRFSGDIPAQMATGVLMANAIELAEKVGEDGFFHTSTQDAPSWRYDGFGTYIPKCGNYYSSLYSRDGGRGILSLIRLGEIEKAQAAADFINDWMMFYPRQYPRLTFGGERIPGHYSVIPNMPLIYSEYLVSLGWPTQYTKERFGDEYQNFGNIEIDGHGLMMMANSELWRAQGKTLGWLRERWEILREGAEFICWCMEHPDLSFCKDDLLYGETEATMSAGQRLYGYSLYGNIPCLLGLRLYAEMAESLDEQEEADRWRRYADRLEEAIGREFTDIELGQWRNERFGFFHDPVPAMFADISKRDAFLHEWLRRSQNTYLSDLDRSCRGTYFAPRGLGYDHNMMTQNALMLDQTADGGKLTENLVCLCYAPRLPKPYITPEGATVDAQRKIIRRQGDLGNLVQQAETVKTLLLTIGLAGEDGVVWTPRLPQNWAAEFEALPVYLNNGQCVRISGSIGSVSSGMQAVSLNMDVAAPVAVRFGPFGKETKRVTIEINGQVFEHEVFLSGDACWAWAEVRNSIKALSARAIVK